MNLKEEALKYFYSKIPQDEHPSKNEMWHKWLNSEYYNGVWYLCEDAIAWVHRPEYVSAGNNVQISGRVISPDVPMTFEMNGQEITTNNQGWFEYTYHGTGVGVKDLIAEYETGSDVYFINDYYTYMKQNDSLSNENYTLSNAVIADHPQGYKFQPTEQHIASFTINPHYPKWEFEFTIVEPPNVELNFMNLVTYLPEAGDIIRCSYDEDINEREVFVNDMSIKVGITSNNFRSFRFLNGRAGSNVSIEDNTFIFNNLKYLIL